MAEEISPLENHGWWMEQLRKDAKANRPEALRLARELEACPTINYKDHAAELRRLHAENALLHERHHFDNGVLKELLAALISFTKSDYIKKQHPKRYAAAVAAIAKTEGEPK